MRMANRIFEDPDSDPEQDPYGSLSRGIDHPGLLLLVHPRPLVVASAVKDFVPIEGARRTVREVSGIYRRFGAADRIAMVEGFHEHRFSDENQDAVFAFLDRFNGLPVRHGFDPFTALPAETLRCTRSGQVREDVGGERSLMEVIRDYYRATRGRPVASLRERYRAIPYPGIDRWPVVRWAAGSLPAAIAWELTGSTVIDGVEIDRYLLRYGSRLTMPLLHAHRGRGRGRRVLLDFSFQGKAGASDWTALLGRLDAGFDVVSFDLRGTGESRMRYRAAGDDPALSPLDETSAYENPLSGVLANHVYNSLLTGRPYLLQVIEDIEVAARFSRVRLGGDHIAVAGRGEAAAAALAASEALAGVEWQAEPGSRVFAWSEAVESLSESWPIQYLLPGGALVPPARPRRQLHGGQFPLAWVPDRAEYVNARPDPR